MSPRTGQRRTLHGIETELAGSDPRLAKLFAMFTALTRDEEMPSAERLRAGPIRLLARLRQAAGLHRGARRRLSPWPALLLVAVLAGAYVAAIGG